MIKELNKDNSRVGFLDVAKGLGIILVVFGHTFRGEELKIFIYSFHIPLFFFISGLFVKNDPDRKFKDFLQAKFKSLLLPYVTFYLLSYLYWLIIERHIRPGQDVTLITPLIGLFYGTDYKQFMLPNGALWFLTCLFVVEMFVFTIVKFVKNRFLILTLFFVIPLFGLLLISQNFIPLPFSINSSFMAVLFTGIGFLTKDYLKKITEQNHSILLLVCLSVFSVVWWVGNKNGLIDMDYAKYHNPLLFLVSAFLGIFACLLLSMTLANFTALKFLGVNSLIIMGLSEPIKRAVIAIVAKAVNLPIDEIRMSATYSLICVILVLIIMIPVIYLFNNYLNKLLGKESRKTV